MRALLRVDIGGIAPGSFAVATWDVHAEGIRIPPVLLFRDDRPVDDVFRLIVQNTRDADNRYDAWFAAGEIYEKRLKDKARARAAYLRVQPSSPHYGEARKRVAR